MNSYNEWMQEIDNLLFDAFQIEQDDLPDWLSRDAFDSGMTPEQAFQHILETMVLES